MPERPLQDQRGVPGLPGFDQHLSQRDGDAGLHARVIERSKACQSALQEGQRGMALCLDGSQIVEGLRLERGQVIGLGEGAGAREDPHGLLHVVVLGQAHALVQQCVDAPFGVAVGWCALRWRERRVSRIARLQRRRTLGVECLLAGDADVASGGTWDCCGDSSIGILSSVRIQLSSQHTPKSVENARTSPVPCHQAYRQAEGLSGTRPRRGSDPMPASRLPCRTPQATRRAAIWQEAQPEGRCQLDRARRLGVGLPMQPRGDPYQLRGTSR